VSVCNSAATGARESDQACGIPGNGGHKFSKVKKKNGINKRIEFLEMEGTNSQKSKKIKIKIKQWNK
jgi:hypothetical protein